MAVAKLVCGLVGTLRQSTQRREHLFRVFTARPVLVNAADFGLESGVTALQQVAGLKAISSAVPVTLQLLFVQAK